MRGALPKQTPMAALVNAIQHRVAAVLGQEQKCNWSVLWQKHALTGMAGEEEEGSTANAGQQGGGEPGDDNHRHSLWGANTRWVVWERLVGRNRASVTFKFTAEGPHTAGSIGRALRRHTAMTGSAPPGMGSCPCSWTTPLQDRTRTQWK